MADLPFVTMFARFGSQARRVIELAEDHARALWRPAVGPEHLLLALLAVDDSGVFARAGVRFDDVRTRLFDAAQADVVSTAKGAEARHLPLRLKSVFRDAFRHAAMLASPEVTPLHLGLALLDPVPGEVAAVLRRLDVDADDLAAAVRTQIIEGQTVGDVEEALPQDERVVRLARSRPGSPRTVRVGQRSAAAGPGA